MTLDLQRASIWKRISAFIFDAILVCVLAVGFAGMLSWMLNYDSYSTTLDDAYTRYETQYGIEFEITGEQYNAMTEAERQAYDAAYDALIADEEAMRAYNMVVNLTMLITTIGILLSFVALEFVVPLLLGNGQTLGKKIFGLCLMRSDCVRITAMQLFVRSILGKFTIETMIPVYIVIMIFFNTVGLEGTLFLLVFFVVQAALAAFTRNHTPIHDMLAGTVVVDYSSQMIFRDTEELLEYKKKLHAQEASRQTY